MNKLDSINLIYITGNSYSGSTLLGLNLVKNPQIYNLGELKYYPRIISGKVEKKCSCNKDVKKCQFWSHVYKEKYDIFDNASFCFKAKVFLRLVLGLQLPYQSLLNSQDYFFLKNIQSNINSGNKLIYLLDTSKSIYRLVYLINCKKINLKILYIQRDVYGNIASFIKRGRHFNNSLLKYLVIHFLINRLLSKTLIPYLKIEYKQFCNSPNKTLMQIYKFLKINNNTCNSIAQHVIAGNQGPIKEYQTQKIEIRYCDDWKQILTPVQNLFISLLCRCFRYNRLR